MVYLDNNNSGEEQVGKKAILLKRLPEERKNPVIRVSGDGTLLYMNRAAEPLKREWQTGIGLKLPKEFIERLNQCLEEKACIKDGIEYEIEDQHIVFVPVLSNDAGLTFTVWARCRPLAEI